MVLIIIADLKSEIDDCKYHFAKNLCNKPLPGIVDRCDAWRVCAARSGEGLVGKGELVADIVAKVIDAFIRALGFKVLVSAHLYFP